MPKRIHEVFGVSEEVLEQEGVFNGFIDVDARFYVDPSLLASAKIFEFRNSVQRFREHFCKVVTILNQAQSATREDLFFRKASKELEFPELQFISLGSSTEGSPGKGIGPTLAGRLADTAWQILRAGFNDPTLFELVGLIENGIGADLISDMTIRIILPDLLAYSERIADKLSIRTIPYKYKDQTFLLPAEPGKESPLVFTPQELLRDLLVSEDWSDIEKVRTQNSELRERTNSLIGDSWKNKINKLPKKKFKELILGNPELLENLVEDYKSKPAEQYDFKNDPAGHIVWRQLGQEFSDRFPLLFDTKEVTSENILHIVIKICNHFKDLIENNGLAAHLWDDKGKKSRDERFAQLLFFAIADSYCNAYNLDLSREVNAGRGPLDFKVSKGYHAKVTVEIKYTSNRLKSGYEKQLPTYNAAEKTTHSVFLVIQNTNSTLGLQRLKDIEKEKINAGENAPYIFDIDGRIKPSASKL